MLFAVVQQPKMKFSHVYFSTVKFIEASNKTSAIQLAGCYRDKAFKAPYAEPVKAGLTLRI